MSEVVVDDGMTIHYDVFGRRDGTPLVMIQGLGTDSRGWALQRLAIGRQFRCITIDNRGVGRTGPAPEPYSLERMALDVIAVLDAGAHRSGPRHGRVDGRRDRADHRRAAPRSGPARSSSPARRAGTTSGGGSCSRSGPTRSNAAGWPRSATRRCSGSSDRACGAGSASGSTSSPGWCSSSLRARSSRRSSAILDAPDELRHELGAIRVPVLVITGSQDSLTPLGDAEELAELIPHARLEVISGAAHGLMAEAPERLQRGGPAVPRRGRRGRRRARRAGRVGLTTSRPQRRAVTVTGTPPTGWLVTTGRPGAARRRSCEPRSTRCASRDASRVRFIRARPKPRQLREPAPKGTHAYSGSAPSSGGSGRSASGSGQDAGSRPPSSGDHAIDAARADAVRRRGRTARATSRGA